MCVCVRLGKQKSWLVWPARQSVRQSVSHSVSQSKAKKRNEMEINAWPAALGRSPDHSSCPLHIPRFAAPPPPSPWLAPSPLSPCTSCQCRLLMFMAHFAILRLSFTKLVRLQLSESSTRGNRAHRGGWGRGNCQSVWQAVKNEAYAERRNNNNNNNNNGSSSKSIDQHTEIIARRKANLKWKIVESALCIRKGVGEGNS